MYMLDTDTCSFVLRSKPSQVRKRFERHKKAGISISEIVLAELYYGAAKHPTRGPGIQALIEDFVSRLTVLPWNAAIVYGKLRATLEAKGKPMGNMDQLIAAHALAQSAILVTNNTRNFSNVPNLQLANWTS